MIILIVVVFAVTVAVLAWVGFDIHNRLPFAFVAQAVALCALVLAALTKLKQR